MFTWHPSHPECPSWPWGDVIAPEVDPPAGIWPLQMMGEMTYEAACERFGEVQRVATALPIVVDISA